MNKNCLIIVDVQYDFMPGGSLPVKEGDQIIPIIKELLPKFNLVIFTRDFHPPGHKSFASSHEDKKIFDIIDLNGTDQILWPDHCVQGNRGSEIHEDILKGLGNQDFYIFKKGMDLEIDSYSGFFDNTNKNSTGLSEFLRKRGVKSLYIVGLAGDRCVKYTALDAVAEGFKTTILTSGIRFLTKDPKKNLEEMAKAGIKIKSKIL